MQEKVLGRARTCYFVAYAQCLIVDCDLDLCTRDMVFAHETSSCYDDYLQKIEIQIPSCRVTLWHGHENTHPHTQHGKHYLPSTILWWGHDKKKTI